MWGFGLWLSPPVIRTLGGPAMTAGCVGLILLKRRSDPRQDSAGMRAADYGLLWALLGWLSRGWRP